MTDDKAIGDQVTVRFYDKHAALVGSVPVDVPEGAHYISVTRAKPEPGEASQTKRVKGK